MTQTSTALSGISSDARPTHRRRPVRARQISAHHCWTLHTLHPRLPRMSFQPFTHFLPVIFCPISLSKPPRLLSHLLRLRACFPISFCTSQDVPPSSLLVFKSSCLPLSIPWPSPTTYWSQSILVVGQPRPRHWYLHTGGTRSLFIDLNGICLPKTQILNASGSSAYFHGARFRWFLERRSGQLGATPGLRCFLPFVSISPVSSSPEIH